MRGAVVPPPHGGREEAFGWFPVSPGGLVHLVRMEKEGGRPLGRPREEWEPRRPPNPGEGTGVAGGVESRLRQSLPGPGLGIRLGPWGTRQTPFTCYNRYNAFCPTTGNKCFVCTSSRVPLATPYIIGIGNIPPVGVSITCRRSSTGSEGGRVQGNRGSLPSIPTIQPAGRTPARKNDPHQPLPGSGQFAIAFSNTPSLRAEATTVASGRFG